MKTKPGLKIERVIPRHYCRNMYWGNSLMMNIQADTFIGDVLFVRQLRSPFPESNNFVHQLERRINKCYDAN